MSRTAALLFASLLTPAALAAGSTPADPGPMFGKALTCLSGSSSSVLAAARTHEGFVAASADLDWTLAAMKRVGFEADAPKGEASMSAATTSAALAHQGFMVAAKMAKDEAARTIPAFRSSKFAGSFEALLTVLTQPVAHASYPTAVRAEGEHRSARSPSAHSHGSDLEDMSASLMEIINRAEFAKKALGKAYLKPAVRYYVLAHGFRDPIALKASSAQVCAEKLDAETIRKLDIAARYMGMPTRGEALKEPAL